MFSHEYYFWSEKLLGSHGLDHLFLCGYLFGVRRRYRSSLGGVDGFL